VRIGQVEIGSLDERGIRARLEREVSAPWSAARIAAVHDGRAFAATNGELGIVPDLDRAIGEAMAFGRRGSPLARLDAWLDALTGRASLPFAMRAEGDAARAWVDAVAAELDRPAVDGDLRRTAAGIDVVTPVVGVRVDRARFLDVLLAPTALGDRDLAIPARAVLPAVDEAGFREAADLVRAVTAPLELAAADRTLAEQPAGLATLLSVEKVAASRASDVPAGAIVPSQRWRYVAAIDEGKVRAWVDAVAAALDRPAKSASYRVQPDGSLAVVGAVDGLRVDRSALVELALAELGRAVDGGRSLSVPLTVEQPRFTTYDAERYLGALTPVGAFETAFPVNAGRYTNIRIGAALFDGVAVAPGEALSFWSVFGDDPALQGFVPAGAIVNGRSDDSVVGGGLCQVSTTLFNAVAYAGYEILERHAHGYLIERYPIGLDAAVFFPGVDMRWRNDTQYPVVIRSAVTATSVSFELLSVPTGRQVSFGGPFQSNWRPVTPELAADPLHAPGYSVDGRDVVRTRTVTEAGTIIHQDTFFSRYIPVWGGPAPAEPR
jgi:vancomycin resistance protein YoaR